MLLSYVNSTWREREVVGQMISLEKEIQAHKPRAWHLCCVAIFDDNAAVCEESLA